MLIRDVMTHNAECVRPDDSLAAAAVKMRDLDVGALPVSYDDGRLAGIVTDRDIVIRGVAENTNSTELLVQDVMSKSLVFCYQDADTQEAAGLMEESQIRRLPVLNNELRLVGMLALADLAVKADANQAGEVLEQVSEPAQPKR